MEWKMGNTRWYITSCSGYTISKALAQQKTKYSAWSPPAKDKNRSLGVYLSRQEAMDACEQHLSKTQPTDSQQ